VLELWYNTLMENKREKQWCSLCGGKFTRPVGAKNTLCRVCAPLTKIGKTKADLVVKEGRSGLNLICPQCGVTFWCRVRYASRRKYCSRQCSWASRKGETQTVICAHCGKHFERRICRLREIMFCSRACKDNAWSEGIAGLRPAHYGAHRKNYRRTAFRHYDRKCADCGWDEIPQVLIVHHIDRQRSNLSPENLVILCPTCHKVRHHRIRNDLPQVPPPR